MIRITPASLSDFPTIAQLAHDIWPATYGQILSRQQLEYMLDLIYSPEALAQAAQSGQRFLLLTDDGVPLGFVGYEHRYGDAAVTRIHKIYVLPQTQGRGLGKLLLEHIVGLAQEAGSEKLSLNVNRFNKAQDFYKKMGFEIAFSEDIDIGRGYLMEDYRMERVL